MDETQETQKMRKADLFPQTFPSAKVVVHHSRKNRQGISMCSAVSILQS